MTENRSQVDPRDESYWSRVAELIDRRDRGERVDPAEFDDSDPVLARRLRECLAGFGWLEQALSGSDSGKPSAGPGRMPESIGEYNIVRELGRGGMGVVYEAVHQGLGRRVALKVLFDSSFQTPTARERFLREARTAASLHHTNIVPVFDTGSADGHLYYAMQLIDGRSLEELQAESRESRVRLDASTSAASVAPTSPAATDSRLAFDSRLAALDPESVARLGLQAAEALAYAHGRGVIHRDVKPSNLLLDSSGTLWIADFGLARRPEDPSVTATGARIGTPRYMSPEQATAQWDAMDARTDVYSLGVTLYELLSGLPLFEDSTPQQLLYRIIRTEPAPLRQFNRRVPRDLETIVRKAMAKRPADRYASAAELADDLRRFLNSQPVRARRIGPVGRLVRWCRREPLVAGISFAAVFALSTVVGAYQFKLAGERDAAIDSERAARDELAESLFQQARTVRESAEIGRRWRSLELLGRSAEIRPRREIGVEAVRALELADVRCTSRLDELGGPATVVAFNPKSHELAAAVDGDAGPAVGIWNDQTKSVSARLTAPEPLRSLAFSPDGRWLAGATERHVCLWDTTSGQLRILSSGRAGLSTVAFTPDSRRVAGFAAGLQLWDVASGDVVARLTDAEVEVGLVEITADGRFIAAAITTRDGGRPEIRRWLLPDLKPAEPLRPADARLDPLAQAMGVLSMTTSSSGRLLAAALGDSRIRVWDLATGRQLAVLEGHRAPIASLAFLPRGDELVSSDGFEVKLWDATDGGELATLIRPNSSDIAPLPAVAASRDGRLATAGDICRVWELATPSFHRVLARHAESASAIATSADGRWSAWLADGRLHIWNLSDGELRHSLPIALRGEVTLTFAESGRALVVSGAGPKPIQVFDVIAGELRADWSSEPTTAMAASHDGREVAIAHSDNVIRRWNVATGQVVGAVAGHVGPVADLAYSPDGHWLAAGNENRDTSSDRTLHVWEVATGRLVRAVAAHRVVTMGVAFSTDGRRIASCGGDRTVKIWNTESGELATTLIGHTQPVRGVAWSPDSNAPDLVASAGMDGHVLVWNANDGQLVADLNSRTCGNLSRVAFSRDGARVLACGGPHRWTQPGPGAVEAWDLNELGIQLSQLGVEAKIGATRRTAASALDHAAD